MLITHLPTSFLKGQSRMYKNCQSMILKRKKRDHLSLKIPNLPLLKKLFHLLNVADFYGIFGEKEVKLMNPLLNSSMNYCKKMQIYVVPVACKELLFHLKLERQRNKE